MAAAAAEMPPPPPKERFQGVSKDSAGYRLMASMGWREGEGLGAAKQGIKSHIRVKRQLENYGVGAVEAAEQARAWTTGMLDFHRVLSNLSEVTSQHARRRASSDDSSEDSSDEERVSDASGGAGAAGRKRKAAEPSSSDGSSGGSSSSGGSDSDDEASSSDGGSGGSGSEGGRGAGAAPRAVALLPPAGRRVKAATHIGRFKKRETAKMVQNYSEHDLAAILGGDPFAATAAAVGEVRAARPAATASDSEEAAEREARVRAPAPKKQKKQRKQEQKTEAAAAAAAAAAAPPPPAKARAAARAPAQPPTPEEAGEGQWWGLVFHRAGRLGAARAAQPPGAGGARITAHGFSEQDQANLYHLAHDGATQGRVGLGRSSMPKKVAGARWAGTKTRLGSDSEDEEEEAAAEDAAPEGQPTGTLEQEGVVIIMPAPRKQQQQQDLQRGAGGGGKAERKCGSKGKEGKRGKHSKQQAAAPQHEQQQLPPPQQRGRQQGTEAPAAAAGRAPADVKWKKAALSALRASTKGRMKLAKLHKALMREQRLGAAQSAEALRLLTACVEGTSKLRLEGGIVRLA
eukprot:scaffold3.g6340.t1